MPKTIRLRGFFYFLFMFWDCFCLRYRIKEPVKWNVYGIFVCMPGNGITIDDHETTDKINKFALGAHDNASQRVRSCTSNFKCAGHCWNWVSMLIYVETVVKHLPSGHSQDVAILWGLNLIDKFLICKQKKSLKSSEKWFK